MVTSSSATMRASLSTSVRAVNQITPYLGCGETRFSAATAARPLSRPWSQLSYCGWKSENVSSPLASCRGHGSTLRSEAAGGSPKADTPDVHPASSGNTSNMKKSANSALRFHRSERFVIYLLLRAIAGIWQRTPARKFPLSSVSTRLADEAKGRRRSFRRNAQRRATRPFAFLPKQDDPRPREVPTSRHPHTSRDRPNVRESRTRGGGWTMIWRSRIRQRLGQWVGAAIIIALAGGLFWMAVKHAERAGGASPAAALGEAMRD